MAGIDDDLVLGLALIDGAKRVMLLKNDQIAEFHKWGNRLGRRLHVSKIRLMLVADRCGQGAQKDIRL